MTINQLVEAMKYSLTKTCDVILTQRHLPKFKNILYNPDKPSPEIIAHARQSASADKALWANHQVLSYHRNHQILLILEQTAHARPHYDTALILTTFALITSIPQPVTQRDGQIFEFWGGRHHVWSGHLDRRAAGLVFEVHGSKVSGYIYTCTYMARLCNCIKPFWHLNDVILLTCNMWALYTIFRQLKMH